MGKSGFWFWAGTAFYVGFVPDSQRSWFRCLNFMTVGLAFVIQKISRLGHTYSLLFYFNLLNFRGVSKILLPRYSYISVSY